MKTFYVALHVRPHGSVGPFCDRIGQSIHAESQDAANAEAVKLANAAGWEVGVVAWNEEQK